MLILSVFLALPCHAQKKTKAEVKISKIGCEPVKTPRFKDSTESEKDYWGRFYVKFDLQSSGGKDDFTITVDSSSRDAGEFVDAGSFVPSYGRAYDVWVQRSPFGRDASGAYTDPIVREKMPKIAGKWYFKASAVSGGWLMDCCAAKSASLTLSVAADGSAALSGKVGSHKISASSAVFIFQDDVATGFARSEFAIPVTVSKTKKTLDIWFKLWFDASRTAPSKHALSSDEGVGAAFVEAFN